MLLKEKSTTTIHSIPDPYDLLSQLRSSFSFGEDSRCLYYERGSSDLYKIYTSRENYFVRLTRAGTRSEANIDAEIDFLKFCNFNGVLVSNPICDVEGIIVQQIQTPEGARPATIFPEVAGNSISKPLPKQLENFGRQLAIFHLQANRYPLNEDIPIYDLDTCLKKSVKVIGEFLRQRPEIREHGIFFQNLTLNLIKKLRGLPLDQFSWGAIHGDFIYSNFKANSNNDITLYDFERLGYGWRAFEISTYIGHLISGRQVADPIKLYTQVRDCFLRGYESIVALSESEKSALPLLYQMQRIWMKSECCERFIDWSSSFMNMSSWAQSVRKHKAWARILCKMDGV